MPISAKKLLHEIWVDDEDQHLFHAVADGHIDLGKDSFLEILCIPVELDAFVFGIFEGEAHEWEGVLIHFVPEASEEGRISFNLSPWLVVVLIGDCDSKDDENSKQQLQQHLII